MILHKFKNKNAASKFAAKLIAADIKYNPETVLGLATGGSMEALYSELINIYKSKKLDFSKIKSFNLDEYLNLNENMENQSYRYFMNEKLFNHININKENTFFPAKYTESYDVDYLFTEYDQQILNAGGIDIQLLGIGVNGHIAFNEPGSSIGSITRVVKLTDSTIQANSRFFDSIDEVPKTAASMGIGSILNAKKIILLAFGQNKKEALEKLLWAKKFDENYPCTALYNHKNLIIITDIE